jgi:hypothetical protein
MQCRQNRVWMFSVPVTSKAKPVWGKGPSSFSSLARVSGIAGIVETGAFLYMVLQRLQRRAR